MTKTIEDITQVAADQVLFMSSRPEPWLKRPARPPRYSSEGSAIPDPDGRKVYKFRDHQLRVKPGTDLLPDGPPGDDGEPTVQDAISWLRSHPGFNSHDDPCRFHESGAEPDRVEPPTAALAAITDAAIYGDSERLEQILEDERAGDNRDVVTAQCVAAIVSVSEAKAELDAADAAAAAENG